MDKEGQVSDEDFWPIIRNERCETCRFWWHEEDYEDTGCCRMFSPEVQIGCCDHERNKAVWPPTHRNEWCGEWRQQKEDEEAT